jgi:PAS domain S-box-containing protein
MNSVILYFGRYEPNPGLRATMLTRIGYEAHTAAEQRRALQILKECSPALVVIDEAVARDELRAVAAEAKRSGALVLAMHRGDPLPLEDAHLGTVVPPREFLRSVASLIIRAHGHKEIAGRLVAYVDSERRYRYVSDDVCDLLGYSCEELLALTIDDVTMPETADTRELFQQYVRDRGQAGVFVLRHKDGHPVPIRYRAHVFEDGCMAAEWEPLPREDAA